MPRIRIVTLTRVYFTLKEIEEIMKANGTPFYTHSMAETALLAYCDTQQAGGEIEIEWDFSRL